MGIIKKNPWIFELIYNDCVCTRYVMPIFNTDAALKVPIEMCTTIIIDSNTVENITLLNLKLKRIWFISYDAIL